MYIQPPKLVAKHRVRACCRRRQITVPQWTKPKVEDPGMVKDTYVVFTAALRTHRPPRLPFQGKCQPPAAAQPHVTTPRNQLRGSFSCVVGSGRARAKLLPPACVRPPLACASSVDGQGGGHVADRPCSHAMATHLLVCVPSSASLLRLLYIHGLHPSADVARSCTCHWMVRAICAQPSDCRVLHTHTMLAPGAGITCC